MGLDGIFDPPVRSYFKKRCGSGDSGGSGGANNGLMADLFPYGEYGGLHMRVLTFPVIPNDENSIWLEVPEAEVRFLRVTDQLFDLSSVAFPYFVTWKNITEPTSIPISSVMPDDGGGVSGVIDSDGMIMILCADENGEFFTELGVTEGGTYIREDLIEFPCAMLFMTGQLG